MKIHYAQPNDTGAYTCHVSTEYGSADCGPSNLLCEATGSIIAASQLPGDKEKGKLSIWCTSHTNKMLRNCGNFKFYFF